MGKLIAFEEVANHRCRDNCWLLISGKVYNVSKFMDEHPGGDDILMASTGKDATDDFEETGHSDDAKKLMQKFYVGDVDKTTVPETKKYNPTKSAVKVSKEKGFQLKMLAFLLPLLIIGIAYGMQIFTKKEYIFPLTK